jgi:hypothetical protein
MRAIKKMITSYNHITSNFSLFHIFHYKTISGKYFREFSGFGCMGPANQMSKKNVLQNLFPRPRYSSEFLSEAQLFFRISLRGPDILKNISLRPRNS